MRTYYTFIEMYRVAGGYPGLYSAAAKLLGLSPREIGPREAKMVLAVAFRLWGAGGVRNSALR